MMYPFANDDVFQWYLQ